MTEIKKVGRPAGSVKPDSNDSQLQIRCKKSEKYKWIQAAAGNGGLSAWVTRILNEAAK
jgi:hypothetical protein